MSQIMKNRIIFWVRLFSWLGIGCAAPIAVFATKFGLFDTNDVIYDELGNAIVVPDVSLNGWGIISCILVGTFISSIFKELADSCTGYSLLKQCYVGFCKTIPLIIAYAVTYFLRNALDQVMFCLIIIIICKLVSTPLNPLPKWKYEKLGKENYSTVTEILTDFVKTHVKRGDSDA